MRLAVLAHHVHYLGHATHRRTLQLLLQCGIAYKFLSEYYAVRVLGYLLAFPSF